MKLKIVLSLFMLGVFGIANATNYKDEHTLPTDSQDLIITYMKTAHEYREKLDWMCTGFHFPVYVAPYYHFPVDRKHWSELCWNIRHVKGFFKKHMRPVRARMIKEVREEFAKEGKH